MPAISDSIRVPIPRRDYPRRSRIRRLGLLALIAGIATLTLYYVFLPKGIEVKVVNRASGPMHRVQIVLGSGRPLDLPSIPPDQSASVRIRRGEASDIRLVYMQPDGDQNDLLRTGFSPETCYYCEDKIVLGVISHMTKARPNTMRSYTKRRKWYDPAIYLPFAPGAGD